MKKREKMSITGSYNWVKITVNRSLMSCHVGHVTPLLNNIMDVNDMQARVKEKSDFDAFLVALKVRTLCLIVYHK